MEIKERLWTTDNAITELFVQPIWHVMFAGVKVKTFSTHYGNNWLPLWIKRWRYKKESGRENCSKRFWRTKEANTSSEQWLPLQSGSCSNWSSFISAKWCNRFEAKLKSDNKGEADSLSLLLSNVAPLPKGCLKLVKQKKSHKSVLSTWMLNTHTQVHHTTFQVLALFRSFIFSNHTQDTQRSVLHP